MIRFIVCLVLLALTGCGLYQRIPMHESERAIEQSLTGRMKGDVIAAWGLPDRKDKLSDGSEVFEYRYRVTLKEGLNNEYKYRRRCHTQVIFSPDGLQRVKDVRLLGDQDGCDEMISSMSVGDKLLSIAIRENGLRILLFGKTQQEVFTALGNPTRQETTDGGTLLVYNSFYTPTLPLLFADKQECIMVVALLKTSRRVGDVKVYGWPQACDVLITAREQHLAQLRPDEPEKIAPLLARSPE